MHVPIFKTIKKTVILHSEYAHKYNHIAHWSLRHVIVSMTRIARSAKVHHMAIKLAQGLKMLGLFHQLHTLNKKQIKRL